MSRLAGKGLMGSAGSALNILVVRPDRLGDVVLATPVLEVIKRHYPRARLTVMVRQGAVPLVRGLACVDEVLVYEPDGRHSGIQGLLRLRRDVRERGFRIAVVLQTELRIALALYLAGVRYRVGPRSKPHSFLFYNRGVRQHRSQVEMHETDYNLQLLRRLGIRVGTRSVPLEVSVSEDARAKARAWLLAKGWEQGTPLIGVHPGMGGSALNWPESHYVECIRALLGEGRRVLVTGGPTEGALLARIAAALGPLGEKAWFYGGPGIGEVDQLAALFSWIDVLIAPSTGPMHMAVALGKPVVTFYPPIRVQSAIRWGPYLADDRRASVMVPEVYCGEDFTCRGSLCNYFPCMKSLTVPQALEKLNFQLGRAQSEPRAPEAKSEAEGGEPRETGARDESAGDELADDEMIADAAAKAGDRGHG